MVLIFFVRRMFEERVQAQRNIRLIREKTDMKFNSLVSNSIASLALSLVCVLPTQATVYNPTTEFTLANNPNGVWTYGWMPTDFSSFNPFLNAMDGPIFDQWYTAGMSGDQTPTVTLNASSGYLHQVAPGQLTIHPGPAQEAAVLRFTAPTSGQYDVVGQFLAGDSGVMQVGIADQSGFIWTATNAGSFTFTNHAMSAGQTLDFRVWGGYLYGNTPLELSIAAPIAPVPEPDTYPMLLLGLGMVCVVAHRRALASRSWAG